jgi:hypothetical protein
VQANSKLNLFQLFCHVFKIINVIKLILQWGAAPQLLSILYPNIAELAGI